MKITATEAMIATIVYADIFDYSLTVQELKTWLLFYQELPQKINIVGTQLQKSYKRTYAELSCRSNLGALREEREVIARRKFKIAQKIAAKIAYIPTVKLIGITGALAMNNAADKDDIDFLIVVEKGTLWVSRFMVTCLVEILGKRRHPQDKDVQDKICLNMFMGQDGMKILPNDRDVFAAHEVLQMQPLWEKDEAYKKFLLANAWVKKFLPNAWKSKNSKFKSIKTNVLVLRFALFFLRLLEFPCRKLQLWYMRNRKTTEYISDNVIRFHPHDARKWIKEALGARLLNFNIPLDKIFYAR